MNVLLPYESLRLSAHVLDMQTLSHQRGQALHLLKILAGRSAGKFLFDRVAELWRGSEAALCYYAQACSDEVDARGYGDPDLPRPRSPVGALEWRYPVEWATAEPLPPDWVGIETLHASHRAALLNYDPAWYAQFAWIEPAAVNLFWPGALPIAGDRLWSDSRGEALVLEQDGDDYTCLLDGREVRITREEIRRCQWRRVWR